MSLTENVREDTYAHRDENGLDWETLCVVFGITMLPCAFAACARGVKKLRGGERGRRALVAELSTATAPRELEMTDVRRNAEPAAAAAASLRASAGGNELAIDGDRSLRFEVAAFGPPSGEVSGAVAALPGIPPPEPHELAGNVLALRRRGKYDYSFLDTVRAAERAGAVGVIIVGHCSDAHVPCPPGSGPWARSTAGIRIPVLTVALSTQTANLSRVGADAVTFRFNGVNRANGGAGARQPGAVPDPTVDPPHTSAVEGVEANRRQLEQDLARYGTEFMRQPLQQPRQSAPAAMMTASAVLADATFSCVAAGKKTRLFCAILYQKCIITPRQARDKHIHRENSKKSGVVL